MIVTKVEPLSKTKYKIYLNHQFAFVLYKGNFAVIRFLMEES